MDIPTKIRIVEPPHPVGDNLSIVAACTTDSGPYYIVADEEGRLFLEENMIRLSINGTYATLEMLAWLAN